MAVSKSILTIKYSIESRIDPNPSRHVKPGKLTPIQGIQALVGPRTTPSELVRDFFIFLNQPVLVRGWSWPIQQLVKYYI